MAGKGSLLLEKLLSFENSCATVTLLTDKLLPNTVHMLQSTQAISIPVFNSNSANC